MFIKVNGAITHSQLPKTSIIGDKVAKHSSKSSLSSEMLKGVSILVYVIIIWLLSR